MPIPDCDKLDFKAGSPSVLEGLADIKTRVPFSPVILDFFSELSRSLRENAAGYPDLAAFAFWSRKGAFSKAIRECYGLRLGIGTVFHSTPSNVPLNFAYSLAAGLLAGNANIVRLPRRNFEQAAIFCTVLNRLLLAHPDIAPYIVLVKYDKSPALNDYFSGLCDIRIVWGGDNTIANMRSAPLRPRAREITFPDRYSLLVIQSDAYLDSASKQEIANSFYNDTYLMDQNACTSPMMVIWFGNKKEEARTVFWSIFRKIAEKKYLINPIQAVNKLAAFCNAAAHLPLSLTKEKDWLITRMEVESLGSDINAHKFHSGFFFEYFADDWHDIVPICENRCQTITYYGFDKNELQNFILSYRPRGVDRIVPIGRSLDFSLVWDGIDLINALSRRIEIQ